MRRILKTIGVVSLCLLMTWTGLRLAQAITASTTYSRISYQKQHWDTTLEAWRSSVISDLNSICTSVTSLGTTVANWVTSVDTPVLINATPTYVAANSFTLPADYTSVLTAGKRLLIDQGQDAVVGNTVVSAIYAAPNTTVTLTYNNLTGNIQAVSYYGTRSGTITYGSGDILASEYGSPSWANLQAVVAVANASGRRLVVTPGNWPVTNDLVITAPVYNVPTGVFQVATTKTLTINGPFEAGLYQAFSCIGTGKVVFGAGAVKEVYHQWWGGKTDGATDSSVAVKAAGDAAISAGVPLVFVGGGECLINTQCKWGNTAAQTSKFIHIKFYGDSRVTSTSTTIDGVFCIEGPHPEVDGVGNRHNGKVLIENPQMFGGGGTSKALKFYGVQGTEVRSGTIHGFGTASWSSNHDIAIFDGLYVMSNTNGIVTDDSASLMSPGYNANSWNILSCNFWDNSGDGVNYYGGQNLLIQGNNFVNNGRDVVIANHATVQPIATVPVIKDSYFEGVYPAGTSSAIILGGGAASGIVRSGHLENLGFIGDAARTALVEYTTVAVDASTTFRRIRNTNNVCATYNKIGVGPDVHIYDDDYTDYAATSTITGWTSFTSKLLSVKREGKRVFFKYYLVGPSDATTTSFTLPYTAGTAVAVNYFISRIRDNSVYASASGLASISASASTVNIYRDWSSSPAAWTASGTKSAAGSGWYDVY